MRKKNQPISNAPIWNGSGTESTKGRSVFKKKKREYEREAAITRTHLRIYGGPLQSVQSTIAGLTRRLIHIEDFFCKNMLILKTM